MKSPLYLAIPLGGALLLGLGYSLAGEIVVRSLLTTENIIAFVYDHVLDRAGILDNLRSTSWIASRDDREDVVARLGALVPEGTYAIPNQANMIWARKR